MRIASKNNCWINIACRENFLRVLQGDRILEVDGYETWTPPHGYTKQMNAPRPRRGHTMVLARKQVLIPGKDRKYYTETYVVMFGGRDNDGTFEHIPRTYNVKKVWILAIKNL